MRVIVKLLIAKVDCGVKRLKRGVWGFLIKKVLRLKVVLFEILVRLF